MIPAHLMMIYNDYGFTDLELSKTYKDKSGEVCFSKWQRFDELMSKEHVKWDEYTERRIADVEIVLDYDEFECFSCHTMTSKIPCMNCGRLYTKEEQKQFILQNGLLKINSLLKDNIKYQAYYTGSKGIHVHLIYPELRQLDKRQREQFKETIIVKYGGELMKKTDRVMITREHVPHRKTGVCKTLFSENKGWNYIK